MRYFLIILVTSCVISCGRDTPFAAPSVDTSPTQPDSLKPEDTPIVDMDIVPSVIVPEDKGDSESVETDLDPDAVADSKKEVPATEDHASKPIIREPIIDPKNHMAHQLIDFIKSELEQDGRESSQIFDKYIERVVKVSLDDYVKEETDEKGEVRRVVDVDEWVQESVFFEPSATAPYVYKVAERDTVFGELAYLDYRKKEQIGWPDFSEQVQIEGKEERVLFIVSLDGEYTNLEPDRIVMMRSPSLEDLVHQKGVFKKEEALDEQAHRLSRLVAYVKRTRVPVHIIGMCDYFCSSYVVPHAQEVRIEPFGEVTFNGNHDTILGTFKTLLQEADAHYQNSILEEINDLDSFSDYFHRTLSSDSLLYEYLSKDPRYQMLAKKIKSIFGSKPLHSLSFEEKKIFLASLSVYHRGVIWNFLHADEIDSEEQRMADIRNVIARLKAFNEYFSDGYYGSQNYDLKRFYHYTGLLTNSSIIEDFNHPLKSNYYVPRQGEDGILYTHISPQNGILRRLRINIHGKNSGYREYVVKYQRAKLPVLTISSQKILTNCGFFGHKASYGGTPQQLTSCFVREEEKVQKEQGIEI